MKLSALFDYQQVDHEKDNVVRLLVTVEAPAIDWVARRPRICILPVLDVSGSMDGPKFKYAREACKKLIEQLMPGDYAGLVTFGERARVVVKPRMVSPALKTELLQKLEALVPRGGTNFSEAVTMSLGALGDLDLSPGILHRVIFFTDGEPTTGVVDHSKIENLVRDRLGACSMSFFGYGDAQGRACDQEFLTTLSDVGRGNYAYVQNPDDALAAFGRELGGLLSTYATDLRLVLEPRNGHSIDRVITQLGPSLSGERADVTDLALELGDILAEEHRHVALECTVRKQDKPLPRDFSIFSVRATCQRIAEDGSKVAEESVSAAKIRFVRPEEAQKLPTREVDEVVALHQLALAQREAEKEAAAGHFDRAQGVLRAFSAEAQGRGLGKVAAVASNIWGGMTDKIAYTASQGYRKSMENGLLRHAKVSSYELKAREDLNGLPLSGGGTHGTSAQAAYSASFTGQAVPVVAAPVPLVAAAQASLRPLGAWTSATTAPAAAEEPEEAQGGSSSGG